MHSNAQRMVSHLPAGKVRVVGVWAFQVLVVIGRCGVNWDNCIMERAKGVSPQPIDLAEHDVGAAEALNSPTRTNGPFLGRFDLSL